MTHTILLLIFLCGLVGVGLAAFFLVVDFRVRGLRHVSTLLLAAVVLIFSGWNLWGYKAPTLPKDYETVKNRVVRPFRLEKATRLEVTRLGKRLVVVKQKSKWQIQKPVAFPADEDAVENLLTEIQMLDRDKVLPGPRTKAEYGFGTSPIVVRVVGATDKPVTLTIGGQDVTKAKVYLARNHDRKVLVVNSHFREAFDKDFGELRDRAALRFKMDDARKLTVKTRDGRAIHLVSKKKTWTLRVGAAPFAQRANAKTVDDLLRKLQDLRATKFLGDGKAVLSRHGLDKPERVLRIDDGQPHELRLGGACPGRREDRVVGRPGRYATAFCVRAKELNALLVKVADLRDARVIGVDETQVSSLEIQAGGKHILLKKKGIDWEVKAPKGARLKKASIDQVEQFIKDLRAQTVLSFLPPPAEGLAKLGLDKPRAILTLTTEKGRTEVLRLGAATPDKNVYAQRSGEKLVVVVPHAVAKQIRPSLLPFRDRTLLSFVRQPPDAVEITATQGPLVEHVVYEGGLWMMKKPLAIKADDDALDAMLAALSQLTAERFVAEAPRPEHGLTPPARKITVLLEKEDFSGPPPAPGARPKGKKRKKETHVLALGKDAPAGGCYGQLDGPATPVVLLKADICRDLRAHLATRRIAEFSTGEVASLSLMRGGATEHLERRTGKWARKGGPFVNETAVEGLLTSLASLRATRVVSYGLPRPVHGLTPPRFEVRIQRKDTKVKPIVLRIGAPLKESGKVVGYYAAREGRGVVYLLGQPSVDALRKAKF